MSKVELMRTDDNGNTFSIFTCANQVVADAWKAQLEARHPHKQTYWTRTVPEPTSLDEIAIRADERRRVAVRLRAMRVDPMTAAQFAHLVERMDESGSDDAFDKEATA